MLLRLWFLILCVLVGAFAPSRAGARGSETHTWVFAPQTTETRLESEPQAAGTHQENGLWNYEHAPGCCLAPENVTTLSYRPTSGVLLQGEAGRTTTVLGSYRSDIRHILAETGNVKSLDFGAKPGGLNVLNVPDHLYQNPTQFWNQYNKPWLDAALGRGDNIIFATKPDWSNLTRVNAAGKLELSGFGKEYLHLRKSGLPSQLP